MICIVENGTIIYGPDEWDAGRVKALLFPRGWSLTDGDFFSPDGIPTPEGGVPGPQNMGQGVRVLPVVEVEETAPDGKVQGGTYTLPLADRVELWPLWVDAPQSPSLDEVKAQAIEELKQGVTGVKFSLWPQDKLLDLSRPTGPAPGYTEEDRARAYQQIDDLNAIRFAIAQDIATAPDLETLQTIIDDYRSLYV